MKIITKATNINKNTQTSATTTTTTNTQNNQQKPSDILKSLGDVFKQCELKHSAPALQPRGIKNKSNWCYVNAVNPFSLFFLINKIFIWDSIFKTLQALLACPPFYNFIRSSFIKAKQLNVDFQNIPCIYALWVGFPN